MFEVYSVAIHIRLIDGVASGLMNMSRAFAKVHGDEVELERRLDAIKLTLLPGASPPRRTTRSECCRRLSATTEGPGCSART